MVVGIDLLDTLTKPFKYVTRKVVAAIEQKAQQAEQEAAELKLIEFWSRQFENDRKAKAEWDQRFDEWEAKYHGDRKFDNVLEPQKQEEELRTLFNLISMAIEAKVDLNVPQPRFKPVGGREDEEGVKRLQGQVEYCVRAAQPSLEDINLVDERRVPKYGGTFKKIHWDNSIRRAGYVGDVTISNPHPKDIIPNAGTTSFAEDMEHYHHVVNRTEAYILRKWPHITRNDLEQKAAFYAEYDEMTGDQRINTDGGNNDIDPESGLTKYTVIETTYKDEDGDICKLWWSGDLIIKHLPKFFYRRDPVTGEILTRETLEAGTLIGLKTDPETGEPIVQQLMTAVEAEYYVPKCWDLVYQAHKPRDKCCWGISAIEDMVDLQESVKKVLHIEEEKILRGTTKILTTDKSIMGKLQDPLSEIIYAPTLDSVQRIPMDDGGQRGIQWIEMVKGWLQLMTGATDAALGKQDPNVKSGKQAYLYIMQANQKVNLQTAGKVAAYKQLYRTIAEFYLAFADDDRSYRLEGDDGKDEYGTFNRLLMLRERNGQLTYPDWDVEIGAEAGFMQNRAEVFNMLMSLAVNGQFVTNPANLRALKALAKLGVPGLNDAIAGMEQEIEEQRQLQQAMLQTQMQQAQAAQMGVAMGPGVEQSGLLPGPAEAEALTGMSP